MCTITQAYLTVGLAGVVAFVLLVMCGQNHCLAAGELGGTEVLLSDALSRAPRSGGGLPRAIAPVDTASASGL